MKQRGCRSNKAHGRKGGQSEVPTGHNVAPVPRILILKVGLTGDNEESVHTNGEYGDPQVKRHPVSNGDGVKESLDSA